MNEFDTLIAGGGLAGSLLALALLERGQRVALIDAGDPASASRVAAGLLTPVGGRRLTRVGPLEAMLPAAEAAYGRLEAQSGRSFYRPVEILRLCRGPEEAAQYRRRRADPDFQPYLGPPVAGSEAEPEAYFVRGGGLLDTEAFLEAAAEQIATRGTLRRETLAAEDVQLTATGVRWADLHAGRVVFCEGHRVGANPWFHWLPVTPVKGEVIGGTVTGGLPEQPVNRQVTLIPERGGGFWLGSTFDRHHPDQQPTEEGRAALLDHLPALMGEAGEVAVTRHRAGIRPAPTDHHAMLGCHPHEPRVAVLNGLGARGALIGPYYAQCLADHLTSGAELPSHVDIARFKERVP